METKIKKIAIIGPESTGKTDLTQKLAHHFDTEWVPEFARFYIDRLEKAYEKKDLLKIAEGQIIWEEDKLQFANKYLFCDTNLIVIKIWSDYKYGDTNQKILNWLKKRYYDYYLLTDIDLPWKQDTQRENPHNRNYIFNQYKQYLEDHKLPFGIVKGIKQARLQCALKLMENCINN